ncbi:helix-turn-helix domain-containing protein [Microbacterium sp. LTA6]|uniref:AraC family transcriptional regulator n=1 Tax=unclassified Microbacterium TaxID=2609290 RepID=UPI003138C40D
MIDARRGVLYPARMPEFHRLPAPPEAAELAAWFWIPVWDIEPGRTSRQDVVAYPALNLVVEQNGGAPAEVQLVGATTAASFRDLRGRGWAVGALLRPASAAALVEEPAALRDTAMPFDAPELLAGVAAAMTDAGDSGRSQAVAVFARWLAARVGEVSPVARQANAMSDLLMTDASILRAEDAAARLHLSLRTLQRLAHRHVGLPPAAMIRRRRLQEAAQRMRDDPHAEIAVIAADLGYADHAHLTRDFRTVLGIAPSTYRVDPDS